MSVIDRLKEFWPTGDTSYDKDMRKMTMAAFFWTVAVCAWALFLGWLFT
jgi:hypothetical protein